MKPRTFVAIAAFAVAVGALVLLGVTVNATAAGGQSVACGNGFHTNMSQAAHDSNVNDLTNAIAADHGASWRLSDGTAGYQAACDSALSTRRGFGWGLLALGAVVFFGALVVQRPASSGRPPTAA
ncbi:hypothetical protein [Amycolatopsis sp. NPDC051371]|uniref:hypothetical protein n=1 Tax=Amycolatopsis sp. NPDC051371 TaxID=3155800 RepID=UPI003415811A